MKSKLISAIVPIAIFMSSMRAQTTIQLKDIFDFKRDSIKGTLTEWLGQSNIAYNSSNESNVYKGLLHFAAQTPLRDSAWTNQNMQLKATTGFLMPEKAWHYKKAFVSFQCINRGMDLLQLLITGYNSKGIVACIDTINCCETKKWHLFSKNIKIKGVRYVKIQLIINGNKKHQTQEVGIGRIAFQVNGKNLTEFTNTDWIKHNIYKIRDTTPLTFEELRSYQNIPSLMNKEILAIGETLHGSETLTECAIDIMKSRILHNNCRLILLEIPFEKGLSINRYVYGDEKFHLDMIANSLELGMISEKMLDFFTWVKEYNKNRNRKVYIFGLDKPADDIYGYPIDIFNFLYRTLDENNKSLLKPFLSSFFPNCIKAMKEIWPTIENKLTAQSPNYNKEFKIISHCWKDWLNVISNNKNIIEVRDSLMYSNILFMKSLICKPTEKVTLYSHTEHTCINKEHTISQYPNNSYGSLLKKTIGNKYATIGLIAYEGKITQLPNFYDKKTYFSNNELIKVSHKHIEKMLSTNEHNYFFISTNKLKIGHTYIRTATQHKQFSNICYISHYLDGIVFMKESKSLHPIHANIDLLQKGMNLIERCDSCIKIVEHNH